MDTRMRASSEQFSILVEFMESHGDLSRPLPGLQGRIKSDNLWQELSNLLNSVGGSGANKPLNKWKRLWSDWKVKTKKKAANLKREIQGTGGGPSTSKPLTHLEIKILNILGLTAITGLEEVQEAGLENRNESDYNVIQDHAYSEPLSSEQCIGNIVNTTPISSGDARMIETMEATNSRSRKKKPTAFERAAEEFAAIENRRLDIDKQRALNEADRIRLETDKMKTEEVRIAEMRELNQNLKILIEKLNK